MRRIACLLSIALLLFAAPASAETTPSRQTLGYNIYIGGLKTFSADLEIFNPAPDNYHLEMKARTEGLLNFFTDWKGTMETQGRMTPTGAHPLFHKSVSIWPDNTQIKEFVWGKDGTLRDLHILEEGQTSGLEDIDDELVSGGVDIMTASLAIMQTAAKEGECGKTTEVFDGKRRFLLTAENKGWETLKASRRNIFEGQALRCEIKIIPQGGNWHEKLKGWMAIQEQGQQAGATPTVWLAQLNEQGPATPVKMQAKTRYGTFLMHLTERSTL